MADRIEPIVFVNNPISTNSQDIVGFETQVCTIETAINNNATMIGVIADYGSGKSSVTEILEHKITQKSEDRKKYPRPIKINMWDCLQETNSEDTVTSEINNLTKSFLFQLANGKSSRLASYINKRLSKNYGIISISFNSALTWVLIIIAVLLFSISEMVKLDSFFLPVLPVELIEAYMVLYDFSPVLLALSVIIAVIGISRSSIAFSHWKMLKRDSDEVNDIFDTYEYIINKLKPQKNRKQIIIIEDLDRIIDKSVIIGFLKELYRFQTSLGKNKKKFVFIISIKPEAKLKNNGVNSFDFDDNKIYSKIFDVTVHLKPIHYHDYDSILIELLNSNPKAKSELEELIGCGTIDSSLPAEFYWIKKGTNLTIRDLKERLNNALAIMVSLKNKQYKVKTAVRFDSCAAVTFLEHQYPEEYHTLIKNEENISNLIESTYKIKNSRKASDVLTMIKEAIDKMQIWPKNDKTEGFTKDLSELLDAGVFDEDFRMYFYTYPKNSHIKTTYEKYLCDLLQLPYKSIDNEMLDESVRNVFGDNHKGEYVVTNTIKGLTVYPEVILRNSILMDVAILCDPDKVFSAIYTGFTRNIDSNTLCIKYVKNFRKTNNRNILADLINKNFVNLYQSGECVKDFPQIREYFVKGLDIEILLINKIFFNTNLITPEEIALLNNRVAVKLIDEKKLTRQNFNYISQLIVSADFREKARMITKKLLEFLISILNCLKDMCFL